MNATFNTLQLHVDSTCVHNVSYLRSHSGVNKLRSGQGLFVKNNQTSAIVISLHEKTP